MRCVRLEHHETIGLARGWIDWTCDNVQLADSCMDDVLRTSCDAAERLWSFKWHVLHLPRLRRAFHPILSLLCRETYSRSSLTYAGSCTAHPCRTLYRYRPRKVPVVTALSTGWRLPRAEERASLKRRPSPCCQVGQSCTITQGKVSLLRLSLASPSQTALAHLSLFY